MPRLAYFVTHPIQYQAPLLRYLTNSGGLDLRVFFYSDYSLHLHREREFNADVKWDVPLTEGYAHEFLPRWGGGQAHGLQRLRPARRMKQLLRAGKFDALWVHGWEHLCSWQVVWAAHTLGLPVLLRGEATPRGSERRTLRAALRDRFLAQLFRRVSAFLCIGSLNRQFYEEQGVGDRAQFTMPYAVDNAFFQTHSHRASLRRNEFRGELGLLLGRPVILFAAKFTSAKAPHDLLAAWLALQAQWPDMQLPYLLFVGDGPLRSQLEVQAGAHADKGVRFVGFRNQTELPAFYDLCDVFVLPSHFEPWGLVVNELMNSGKPIIVSDRVGAAPDLVANGVNGFIYPAGDVAALALRLKQVLEPPIKREEMGRKSLERINTWDFEADRKGLLEALDFVCSHSKNVAAAS